jgi:hypothetical protein
MGPVFIREMGVIRRVVRIRSCRVPSVTCEFVNAAYRWLSKGLVGDWP